MPRRKKRNTAADPNMVLTDEYVEKTMTKMEQGEDEIRWEFSFPPPAPK
jgi:hypothetical protein